MLLQQGEQEAGMMVGGLIQSCWWRGMGSVAVHPCMVWLVRRFVVVGQMAMIHAAGHIRGQLAHRSGIGRQQSRLCSRPVLAGLCAHSRFLWWWIHRFAGPSLWLINILSLVVCSTVQLIEVSAATLEASLTVVV